MGGRLNTIGGTTPGAGNRIAFNGDDGIELQARFPNAFPIENRLLGNTIFSNTQLGIDLGNNGFSSNDTTDLDEFWNLLQNFPAISSAGYDTNANQLVIAYRVTSDPLNSAYPLRVEFFRADAANQEGQTFLGAVAFTVGDFSAGTDRTAIFTPAAVVAAGNRIVSTATDANGNTSEFSPSALLVITQATPSLKISTSAVPGTAARLTWPSSATNFQLECTESLSPPIAWQLVTNGIGDDGTNKTYVIANEPGVTKRFYRLRRP